MFYLRRHRVAPQVAYELPCEIRRGKRFLWLALAGERAILASVPCEKHSVNLIILSYNGMADPSQMLFYSVYLDIYTFLREDVELIMK